MNIRLYISGLLVCIFPIIVRGQAIDNTLSYKNINSDHYFRLNYDNDFFSAADRYYTQGVAFELVSPWISHFFLTKLLVQPKYNSIIYGLGFESDGYTPTDIADPQILHGDRPFAACELLKTFLTAIDPIRKQRFSSALYVGIIGQSAEGMAIQTTLHRWLHNLTPRGWPHQIRDDAALNYQVNYEKELYAYKNYFLIDADGMARLGTLSDKAALGTTVMLGYFDSPYRMEKAKDRTFRLYAYDHAEMGMIGYDATLQGGVFDGNSPYMLYSNDIARVTFQNRVGFTLVYKRFYLEYFQAIISQEFNTGKNHKWGGIQIALKL